ncbi:MAG: protein translocase subunit SecF [Patescibacteria group bacterium]|nr:protein translocase subunit SecF [Patescibacteria group bacterium]
MNIIKYRYIWYITSAILIGASLFALLTFGLKQGIDFAGGSLLSVRYEDGNRPTAMEAQQILSSADLGGMVVQPVGETDMNFRLRTLKEDEHQKVLGTLRENYGEITELRFDSIGPVIGQELRSKSITALIIVFIAILIFIGYTFRKVSIPVASWKYGLVTVFAAFHDVIIPVGVFAILGKYFGIEIGTSFIAAILTVMGYSINDTIVVFDRIRENLQKTSGTFVEIVNISLNQTILRSINTSLTTILALTAVYFFGGESIRDFALTLIIGIIAGTYSSIFIASPLLVTIYKYQQKMKARKA